MSLGTNDHEDRVKRALHAEVDGHFMHAIIDGAFVGTWPCPIPTNELGKVPDARAASTPLPPPSVRAGFIRAQRQVHVSGRNMVPNQPIKLVPRHAGKLVTVVIEHHLRISTATKSSPSNPAATPGRSPGSTSEAKAPSRPDR